MLRAPICTTSAYSAMTSACALSSSSVTIGRPVCARASARISSAGTPRPLNANGEVRGLNAPPRSIAAPPACTARATPSVCSRVSTVHGPAISVKVAPPPTVRPAMSKVDGSWWLSSLEASLYGREIGTTRSTPLMPSSPSSATPAGSPIAPIAVVSSPGITTTCTPVVSTRATTASISADVACGVITIITAAPSYGARPSEFDRSGALRRGVSPPRARRAAALCGRRGTIMLASVLRRIVRLPLTARPWVDLWYLTLGLLSGCVTGTLILIGPATGALLLITLIGIPKLYGDFWICRWWANLERRRSSLAGVPIPPSLRRWEGRTLWRRLLAALGDPMTWRELAWFVLLFGLGLGCFLLATIVWFTALGLLVGPAWMWAVPDGVDFGVFTVHTAWEAVPLAIGAGIPLTILAAWIVRGSTVVQA